MIEKLFSLKELRDFRLRNGTLGFVPTMGALHDGHIGLVDAARGVTDRVIVSIFVNPKQFAPHEDFDSYPRQIEADMARLEQAGADAVYLPTVDTLYPEGFATTISVKGVTEPLEGVFRPHFFDGVTTVVAKLFFQVMPDKAFFGEKDFQQLSVIRKLVRDLDLPVEIVGVETMRDQDSGLALSSRNAYLTDTQRMVAETLNKILTAMRDKIASGDEDFRGIEHWGREEILRAGFSKVDYCDIRDAATLVPADSSATENRILAAAWIDHIRLIDNISVSTDS